MSLVAGLLFWTGGVCPSLALEQESQTGPMIVQVEKTPYYLKPPPPRKSAGVLKKKQKVQAIGKHRVYIQVKLSGGSTAYVPRSALIAADKYEDAPADEEDMMRLKAEGYEAGRFDPETEKEYIKQKGPTMAAAYRQLDEWMGRLPQRGALEGSLTSFRQTGKLGEFSPVK